MTRCFDEGVLQAYCDSELSSDRLAAVAGHLRTCERCRNAISSIESENSLLDDAFQPVALHPIESDRLYAGIQAAIALEAPGTVESPRRTAWLQNLQGSLSAWFTVRTAFASALAILVIGIAAVVATKVVRTRSTGAATAEINRAGQMPAVAAVAPLDLMKSNGYAGVAENNGNAGTGVIKVARRITSNRPRRGFAADSQIAQLHDVPLPAEEGYLKAIASLTGAIHGNGENSLRPSVRATYEQNLAIVDRSIDATRETARRYPQNKDAAAFLYSAYQSKLDLLNAVADQSLIASR